MFLERRNHPFCTDDLFLPFTGINPMFRKKDIPVVDIPSKAGQKTAISGTDCMIHIRLRHFCSHQIEHRQKHGTHGMKGIRKGNVRILFLTALCQNLKKLFTFQKCHRIEFFIMIQTEENFPVRSAAKHQFFETFLFLF